jgi:hypothetical protein
MLIYRDDQLKPEEKTGYPLLFDAQKRFWSHDPKAGVLRVRVNDAWAEGPVVGLTPAARMVQGPDGRLWLLHAEALSEVELDTTDAPNRPRGRPLGVERPPQRAQRPFH